MGRVKQLDQVLKLINMIQLSLVLVRTSGRTRFCYCTSIPSPPFNTVYCHYRSCIRMYYGISTDQLLEYVTLGLYWLISDRRRVLNLLYWLELLLTDRDALLSCDDLCGISYWPAYLRSEILISKISTRRQDNSNQTGTRQLISWLHRRAGLFVSKTWSIAPTLWKTVCKLISYQSPK